jgi:hypothetical protein
MSAIAAGFFSFTSTPPGGDEEGYLRWHLLDHLPEQYTIPGIRLATRWRADDELARRRLAVRDDLAGVRHVMSYLLVEPVEATLAAFVELGGRLREEGRYPHAATPHLLGAYERTGAWSAPGAVVTADALPFRAHRGVFLVVERPPLDPGIGEHWRAWHDAEHVPALLDLAGVAGVCTFSATARLGQGPEQGARFGLPAWDPRGLDVTVIYLDGGVVDTASRLAPRVEERWRGPDVIPHLAGPFRSTTTYEAWPDAT